MAHAHGDGHFWSLWACWLRCLHNRGKDNLCPLIRTPPTGQICSAQCRRGAGKCPCHKRCQAGPIPAPRLPPPSRMHSQSPLALLGPQGAQGQHRRPVIPDMPRKKKAWGRQKAEKVTRTQQQANAPGCFHSDLALAKPALKSACALKSTRVCLRKD